MVFNKYTRFYQSFCTVCYDGTSSSCNCIPSQDDCVCYPSPSKRSYFIAYAVFFSISMFLELVKILIAIGDVSHNNSNRSMTSWTKCRRNLLDSWVMLALLLSCPSRYRDIKNDNDNGRLPVCTAWKIANLLVRDVALVIMTGVDMNQVRHWNGLFICLVVAVVIRLIVMFIRRIRTIQKEENMALAQGRTPIVVTNPPFQFDTNPQVHYQSVMYQPQTQEYNSTQQTQQYSSEYSNYPNVMYAPSYDVYQTQEGENS